MRQQNRVGLDCGAAAAALGFGLGPEAGIRMPLIPHGHGLFKVETRSQHVEFDRNWGLDNAIKGCLSHFSDTSKEGASSSLV